MTPAELALEAQSTTLLEAQPQDPTYPFYSEAKMNRREYDRRKILFKAASSGRLAVGATQSITLESWRLNLRHAQRLGIDQTSVRMLEKYAIGQTEAEIGKLYGCSQSTVSRRLDKACEIIRDNPMASSDPYFGLYQVIAWVFGLSVDEVLAICRAVLYRG